MAGRAGWAAQCGYGIESVYGTGVTPTRFLPFASENVNNKIARIDSSGILAGRYTMDLAQFRTGNKEIGGTIVHPLFDHSTILLFKHAIGTYAVTGTNPYTHTMSPGDLFGLGLTTQIGRPGTGGTIHPFTWSGCKINKWKLECKQNAIAMLTLDLIAQDETTATALATVSYASNLLPVYFAQAAVTVNGTTLPVKDCTIDGDNHLARRYFLGSPLTSEPIPDQTRDYTLSLVPELIDLVEYNRYVAGSTMQFILTLTAGANTYTFTMSGRYDDVSPNVAGTKILDAPIKATIMGGAGTADVGALQLVAVNADATA